MKSTRRKTHKVTRSHRPEGGSVLLEAEKLVGGDRHADYGHPLADFARTAVIWSAILGHSVTPEQVALCMIGVKLSRHCHRPKRDNLVDIAGYARCLDLVHEARQAETCRASRSSENLTIGRLARESAARAARKEPGR